MAEEDEVGFVQRKNYVSKDAVNEPQSEPKPKGVGCRHVIVFMCFLAMVNQYSMRVNLSVALVAMVNQTVVRHPNENSSEECIENVHNHSSGSNSSSHSQGGEFPWGTELQGIILGAFFYGYLFTQIPGGWLADRYGAKHVIGSGLLVTGVLTILTPLAARTDKNLFIALRVGEGLGEGLAYPAMYSLLGKWLPPLEVSKYGGIVWSGSLLGTVLALPISGVLCQSDFLGGWPSVFYLFGGVTCIWYVLWLCLAFSEPNTHPRISEEERKYINAALFRADGTDHKRRPTPWKAIFSSMPVWALVIGTSLPCLMYYTLLTCLPTYFDEVLRFNISEVGSKKGLEIGDTRINQLAFSPCLLNGFLSALPFFAGWIATFLAGFSADFLQARHILSTTAVRKIYTGVALLASGALLIGVGYVGCHQTAAVVLMTLAFGIGAFTNGGREVNLLDIAPYFAGSIYGIVNMVSTIPGFIGPYLVGYFTAKQQTIGQWLKVFYINVGFSVVGTVFYIIFASGVRQSWDIEPQELDVDEQDERRPLIRDDKEEPRMVINA